MTHATDGARSILYAVKAGDDYQLNLGVPDEQIPTISWRRYLEKYAQVDPEHLSDEELEAAYWISRYVIGAPYESEWYEAAWSMTRSSNARAFHYLSDLDLGPLARWGG